MTSLDSQQSIDPELKGSVACQLSIKLLVASVHNLRVLLIFFDSIQLFPDSCNILALESILKSVVLQEKVSCAHCNFYSPSIQLPVS